MYNMYVYYSEIKYLIPSKSLIFLRGIKASFKNAWIKVYHLGK